MDAATILQHLHGGLLRAACSASGSHYVGLGAAARHLFANGRITSKFKSKLLKLDIACAFARHINEPFAGRFLHEFKEMLQAGSPPPESPTGRREHMDNPRRAAVPGVPADAESAPEMHERRCPDAEPRVPHAPLPLAPSPLHQPNDHVLPGPLEDRERQVSIAERFYIGGDDDKDQLQNAHTEYHGAPLRRELRQQRSFHESLHTESMEDAFVQMVTLQTGCSADRAISALRQSSFDLADAILLLVDCG